MVEPLVRPGVPRTTRLRGRLNISWSRRDGIPITMVRHSTAVPAPTSNGAQRRIEMRSVRSDT